MGDPLLEFECRPSMRGYDVLAFDEARASKGEGWDSHGYRPVVLGPDATDDEKYLAKRWGGFVPVFRDDEPRTPRVIRMLRPRSERCKHFDFFQSNPSAFLEFAQTPLTADGVRTLADRYGPLRTRVRERRCIDDFWGHHVDYWRSTMNALRKAVEVWDKTKVTGDYSQIIRIMERGEHPVRLEEVGTGLRVLLKKDPLEATARLCIRPIHLRDAVWIQLAHAISGSQSLATCVECKAWFTISTDHGRSDKEYCSNACRMRAYRKRRAGKKRD